MRIYLTCLDNFKTIGIIFDKRFALNCIASAIASCCCCHLHMHVTRIGQLTKTLGTLTTNPLNKSLSSTNAKQIQK